MAVGCQTVLRKEFSVPEENKAIFEFSVIPCCLCSLSFNFIDDWIHLNQSDSVLFLLCAAALVSAAHFVPCVTVKLKDLFKQRWCRLIRFWSNVKPWRPRKLLSSARSLFSGCRKSPVAGAAWVGEGAEVPAQLHGPWGLPASGENRWLLGHPGLHLGDKMCFILGDCAANYEYRRGWFTHPALCCPSCATLWPKEHVCETLGSGSVAIPSAPRKNGAYPIAGA